MNAYKKGNKIIFKIKRITDHKPQQKNPIHEGIVVGILEKNRAKVKTKQGKIHEIGYLTHEVYRLVPKSKIPKYWRETLKLNPKATVYVVYLGHTYIKTTSLICKKTLLQLSSSIRSEKTAEIKLWDKENNASEGKPEMQDSKTIYLCGAQEIKLPEKPERYA